MPSKNYTGIRVSHDMSLAERLTFYSCRSFTGCLIWTGTIRDGYGRLRFNGTKKNAHVWKWEDVNGPVPDGLHVLHKCDVRACIEEDHLFLGNNAVNVADKMNKARQAKGDALSMAVQEGMRKVSKNAITDDQIRTIRAAVGTNSEVARNHGTSRQTVRRIRAGLIWKHV